MDGTKTFLNLRMKILFWSRIILLRIQQISPRWNLFFGQNRQMLMLHDFRFSKLSSNKKKKERMDKCDMKSRDKVEIAKQAIKEMMEEHEVSEHKPTAKHLLVQLLSQLASLQEEEAETLCPEVDGTEAKPKEQWDSLQEEDVEWDPLQEEAFEKWCPEVDGTEEKPKEQLMDSLQEESVEKSSPEVDKTEEIIKEVRNVKRQNLITHCLVSTMILLTVVWQISEVSLLLKVKNGLKNPFDFFGGIVKGMILKGARSESDGEQSSDKKKPVSQLPSIKFPDLNLLDLPIFESSDGE